MAQTERKIEIEIRAKTEQALSEINRLNKELNKLKKTEKNFKAMDNQVKQMSRSFTQLATHVGKLAVIYGTFEGLNTTIRTFAEFEHSINRLGVISGATGVELQALTDKAMELGETTIFSASQVADGLNSLAMAGLSSDEQLSAISSTLDLATIGMLSLNDASLIAVRTMGSFNKEADDVAQITDIMAVSASNSAQTVEDLGDAYEKVGSVATAFGISMEETTASLMVMADAGRKRSEAGTQLKILMSRLAGNKEAKKYIDELGISMFDANGKLLQFKQQLILLKDALAKLPEQQRNIKLGQIVGSEAKATTLVLMNNIDKISSNVDKLKGSFGTAGEMARKLQQDLKGSYLALMSALETLAIKIGTVLTPTLEEMLFNMTQGIRNLNDADIKGFANNVKDIIDFIKSLSEAIATMLIGVASITQSISNLTGISTGWIAILATVVYKLRSKVIPAIVALRSALSLLFSTNPYLLALTAGLIAIDVALTSMQASVDDMRKSTEDFNKSFYNLYDLVDGAFAGKDVMDAEGLRVTLKALADESDATKYKINKLKKELASEEDRFFLFRDNDKIETLKTEINSLEKELKNADLATKALKDRGNELSNTLKDESNSAGGLKNKLEELEPVQKKALAKSITNLESRKKSLETTLSSMTTKEERYYAKIAELEAKTAQIRKKYADERISYSISIEQKLANARNKGLNDYQKYNDAQKRAGEALAKSKEYLEKGNLEISKKYYDEYMNLIEVGAGDEISIKKEVSQYNSETHQLEKKEIESVQKTRQSTLREYESNVKNGQVQYMDWLKAKEKKEIDANQKAIEAEKLKLETLKAQMDIQKQMLLLVTQMLNKAKGVKFEPDLTSFDTAMAKVDTQLKDLETKQRKIKIDGVDTTEVKKDYDKIEKSKIEPVVEPVVEDKKFETWKHEVVTDELITQITADKDKADAKVSELQREIEKQGIKPVDADTANALAKARQLQDELSKRVDKYVYIHTMQANQNGGEILPRFQTGGSLDNGEGHSRKSGKLSGYGGGDKVKALLEAGEFIVRKEAVKSLGLYRMYQINQGKLPRYQAGGGVNIPRFNSGGSVTKDNSKGTVELNLNLGSEKYKTVADEDVAIALAEHLQRSSF